MRKRKILIKAFLIILIRNKVLFQRNERENISISKSNDVVIDENYKILIPKSLILNWRDCLNPTKLLQIIKKEN